MHLRIRSTIGNRSFLSIPRYDLPCEAYGGFLGHKQNGHVEVTVGLHETVVNSLYIDKVGEADMNIEQYKVESCEVDL